VKSLLVMRHAKSAGAMAGQDDFDRELDSRGRGYLPRMGRAIAAADSPQLVLSSCALRARQTTEGLGSFLPDATTRYDDGLYLATPATLHETMAREGGDADCILVVAHNPGLEMWIEELCGAQVVLPTAGLACIDFGASSWQRLSRGAGQLRFYLIPRLLEALEA
jgi:phosphohistidine phosphatase